MILDAKEGKDKELDAQQDFDLRWTANSMYGGRYVLGMFVF